MEELSPPDRVQLNAIERLEWHAITRAINKKFRNTNLYKIEKPDEPLEVINLNGEQIELCELNLRKIKETLRSEQEGKSNGNAKLDQLMGFECNLETLNDLVVSQSTVPRIRSFWFKFIHCFTRANVHYERFGIIDNEACTWCEATPQTREHLYPL